MSTESNILDLTIKTWPDWIVTAAFRQIKYGDSPHRTIHVLKGSCSTDDWLLYVSFMSQKINTIKQLIAKGIEL